MRHVDTLNDEVTYGIHQVYYGEDKQVAAWGEMEALPCAGSEEKLKALLECMMMAFGKPTLDDKGYPVVDV